MDPTVAPGETSTGLSISEGIVLKVDSGGRMISTTVSSGTGGGFEHVSGKTRVHSIAKADQRRTDG